MSDDMVAWLRAQLDDDERVAQAAGEPMGEPASYPDYRTYSGDDQDAADEYIRRFSPARQLRKVKAMREILDRYEERCERVRNPVSADARAAARVGQFELEGVVRLLAATVDDRPGYREEWRP